MRMNLDLDEELLTVLWLSGRRGVDPGEARQRSAGAAVEPQSRGPQQPTQEEGGPARPPGGV